jgi:prepilin-type N-terminal cleavage/methylation domain-containing protein
MGKLKQDNRGFSAVEMVVVIVVLAVIGAVGYVVYKNHNKSTPTSSSSSTNSGQSNGAATAADTSCLATYHDANLCHFAGNSTNFDKTAYMATLKQTNSQGTTTDMTLASDGKGNTSLVATSGGQQISSISLNGNTYIQSGSGTTWIEYPSGSSANTSQATNPTSGMSIGVGSSGITYKAEGTASCGSLTCYKYQILDSAQPSTTQYAWFDNSSYKLREWQSTDSTNGTLTMNITYQTVNITAPSPVQQYSL